MVYELDAMNLFLKFEWEIVIVLWFCSCVIAILTFFLRNKVLVQKVSHAK